MSTLSIRQPHVLASSEARDRLGSFEQDLAQRGVRLDWSGNRGTVKGTGVSGFVQVLESEVVVEVKLGLLARAAGVKPELLRASIEKRLKSALVYRNRHMGSNGRAHIAPAARTGSFLEPRSTPRSYGYAAVSRPNTRNGVRPFDPICRIRHTRLVGTAPCWLQPCPLGWALSPPYVRF